MRLIDDKGQRLLTRHPKNPRGDASSVQSKKEAIKKVGILQDMGGGPFAMQDCDPSNHHQYSLLHHATRVEGLYAAFEEDTSKRNVAVQSSVSNGLKLAKVYSRDTPVWATTFLVNLGNSLNNEATLTTIIEKFMATKELEAPWKRKALPSRGRGWGYTILFD